MLYYFLFVFVDIMYHFPEKKKIASSYATAVPSSNLCGKKHGEFSSGV